MTQFFKQLSFYSQILTSFSRIGFLCRRLLWKPKKYTHDGQVWLITGASGGIGKAVVEGAMESGATVVAVARNQVKLEQLRQEFPEEQRKKLKLRLVDLSLQSEIDRLLDQLIEKNIYVDVLINNVGVLLDSAVATEEGVETAFATNLLNHFQLTQGMMEKQLLAADATVVNVVSGGMYGVPLEIDKLDVLSDQYNGVTAYANHKRGQAVLTQYWRDLSTSGRRQFYAMHPGWADTQGVQTSLPQFRKILKWILRDSAQGADTILWLAGERPKQLKNDSVWFDRKPREAHYLDVSRQGCANANELVDYLQSRLL